MPDSNILIVRPRHDITTNYLFEWNKPIIKIAEEKGISFSDFGDKKAVRTEIEAFIKKRNPGIILFNGHGDENTIYGYRNEALIKLGTNEDLLSDKLVYALSCDSARKLGKGIKHKNGAFIGYSNKFIFLIDENKSSSPLQDNMAGLFLEPSNEIGISLLKGNTAKEAHRKSQEMFGKKIKSLLTSEAIEMKDAVPWLIWDRQFQQMCGNPDSKFE